MKKDELNNYILHYIREDKTKSAIMLTAPWGSGKSYYIQNQLIPFLEKEENGSCKCIVVSLYGLKSIFELNKSLYLETRIKLLAHQGEKIATGIFAAKTVIKGVTSFFGVDLSKSEEEMKQLYESVNLSGKLVILEDIERTSISTLELLGYVNSLVEQDEVKVLLVANESELIQYEPIQEETAEKQKASELLDRLSDHKGRRLTVDAQNYLLTKEKTVSDTIQFEGDYASAVKEIISGFNQEHLKSFSDEKETSAILELMHEYEITNLRTLIFACQKANDIFEMINPDIDQNIDFVKTILYSIIIFSHGIKSGERPQWKGNDDFSVELSSEEFPLLRFCFDYVTRQSFDIETVQNAREALSVYRLYNERKSVGDKDLQTLYNWWICSEKEVLEAINNITARLHDEKDISFYEYGRIALYLIQAKGIIGCNIAETKKLLISNLHNKGNIIIPEYLFTALLSSEEDTEVIEEYKALKKEMSDSLSAKEQTLFGFDYQPSSIIEFSDITKEKEGRILTDGAFVARLDPNRITEMLKTCSALEIYYFRLSFLSIYRASNIKDFLAGDKDNLLKLWQGVTSIAKYKDFDKIQRMQIRFFSDNLQEILTRL